MGINAVDHSVNIIAMHKNGINYGMCAAWATQASSDRIICVIGSQSVTGNSIKKGDIIGFSCLNSNQTDIAYKLGSNHSDTSNKFDGVDFYTDETAILINNAKTCIKCKVTDVLKLEGIESSNVLYLQYIDATEHEEAKALHMSDL